MDSSTSNTCSSSSSSNDGGKNWETELDAVRQYLLSNDSPFPPTHIGITAALNGIEMEMKRRLRDNKLQQKFIMSQSKSTTSTTSNTSTTLEGDYYEIDVTKIDTNTNNTTTSASSPGKPSPPPTTQTTSHDNGNNSLIKNSTMMTDDWEDVTEDDVMVTTTTTTTCTTEQTTTRSSNHNEDEMTKITKYVVATLAEQNILCRHPISALAVVLHIVLLQSNHHKFICTGKPEHDINNTNSNGGFAPPIRDLPVGQLLPLHWEDDRVITTNQIRFRYRKVGYGTYILSIIQENNTTEPVISITLESNQKSDTETQNPLRITITDHINLLSWDTATKSSSSMKISPVLHYKGLSIFVRQFMEHFHLITTTTTWNHESHHVPSNDHFASHYAHAIAIKDIPNPKCGDDALSSYATSPFVLPNILTATTGRTSDSSSTGSSNNNNNNNNNQFYGGPSPIRGQFDGDLYPSGIPAPFPHSGMGMGIPGNLMGPNHPIFNTRYGDEDDDNNSNNHMNINNTIGIHGGMMKPRFDPFGPPGGPTELQSLNNNNHHYTRTKLPGGTGNPNNDLGIPPPLNNNNMFL